MEGKKISFGFMKTKKAEKPINSAEEKRDYIECVEEKSIKVVGGEDAPTNEPLVIPMKPNTLMTADRLKEIAQEVESELEEPLIKTETEGDVNMTDPLAISETLDQMAVRELMQEAKKEVVAENTTMAIPSITKGVAEGEQESTLDDYEAVPVQEFGVAMLRGMGWTPGQSGSKYKQPELRPKGLGLGADKVVKAKQAQTSKDGKQEELILMKNAFVKITCGKYSDFYGKVVSLDEDNGRVMVDIPLKKETVSLSEFMMQVVTKTEYDRESKVINSESYEEYKRKESSKKSSNPEKYTKQRQDNDENDEREEKDKYKRVERNRYDDRDRDKEVSSRSGRDRERRDRAKETESSDDSAKGSIERREEKYKERREERDKFKREEREKERRDEREKGRRDEREKERREEREKERREEREKERRDERDKERREKDRRDEKEKETRDRRDNSTKNEKRTQNKGDSEEDSESDSDDSRRKRDQRSANGSKHRNKRDSSSEDRSVQKKKDRNRDSSTDSLSYLSDNDKKQHKHSKIKTKDRTPEGKRDIDKKRKGKKKKRDRDRSPNYKKYRK